MSRSFPAPGRLSGQRYDDGTWCVEIEAKPKAAKLVIGTALLALAVWKYAGDPWSSTTAVLVPLLGVVGILVLALGAGWRGGSEIVGSADELEFLGQTIAREEIVRITSDAAGLKLVGVHEVRTTLVGLNAEEVAWLQAYLEAWHASPR
jgi:hypothetical protein